MLAAGGVHPYVMRRRREETARRKASRAGIAPSLVLVLLFLIGFAFGLRAIDRKYAPVPPEAPAPALEDDRPASERMAEGLRFLLGIKTAQAAHEQTYGGRLIGKPPVVTAAPGETVTVDLQFKNTGRATWANTGRSYVSAYTIKPRYHASVFRSADWASSSQTPRLLTPTVRRGETGTLRLTLTAPKKPGTYTDTFQIAAEDTSWIWGAWTTVTMKVSDAFAAKTPPPAALASDAAPADAPPAALAGRLTFQSAERIEAPGGVQMTLRLVFRNDGTAAWKKHGLRIASFKAPEGGDAELVDPSWASPEFPVVAERLVPPGLSTDLYFTFTTPRKKGDYHLRLQFVSDGAVLESAPVELPIKVIADALAPRLPAETAPQGEPYVPPSSPSGEPTVRVGLYTTEKEEEITSGGPFEARTPDGMPLASFPAGSVVRFRYDLSARIYRLTGNGVDLHSVAPIRFVQAGSAAYFTLRSYENRPKWNTTLNDNLFRGVIELRKNDRNDYVWVINELPIEQYLHGLAETSNASHAEFQKSLAVAARSYAYWHLTHPGKHWHFTVDATYDQVYKGYGSELRQPRWVASVNATRGEIVTYAGEPVVTPYFTWSDGRTRAWTEVWGGSHKPWLVSVPATYDAAAGRALFGHGVGMSAWDAIGRANAGEAYGTILSYYYSGTGLKKAY